MAGARVANYTVARYSPPARDTDLLRGKGKAMSKQKDSESYLPLTPAMFHILLALADGEKHGYAILKEVARRTDGKVRLSAGTLYGIIKRLNGEDWIVESTK